MISKISFYVVATALLLDLALATVDEEQGAVHFTYSGENGPSNWSKLKPEYATCSSGKSQSPVNIKSHETVLDMNLKPVSEEYIHVANATLINWGFIIGLHYGGETGGIEIDGKEYTFKQMHWHTPSEHRINGRCYPAELHLVHQADDHSSAVIGILFEYGHSPNDVDPFLAKLEDGLKELAKKKVTKVPIGMLETKPKEINTRSYYRYTGSFTTPPCTEDVIWTVLAKPRLISREQVKALKAPLDAEYKENARPEQELNGRKIELYSEFWDFGGEKKELIRPIELK